MFPVSSGLPEHVVFADSLSKLDLSNENEKIKSQRVTKYAKNSGMSKNNDGKVMKSEIATSVQKYKIEGLAYKAITRCENIIDSSNKIFTGDCVVGNVVDGFIINNKVSSHKVDSCNKNSMTDNVKIIVLHWTAEARRQEL